MYGKLYIKPPARPKPLFILYRKSSGLKCGNQFTAMSLQFVPFAGTAEQLWDWGAPLVTQYWGGGGGTKHFFLLILYNFKNIGGGTCPPCPPPPPPYLLRGPWFACHKFLNNAQNDLHMPVAQRCEHFKYWFHFWYSLNCLRERAQSFSAIRFSLTVIHCRKHHQTTVRLVTCLMLLVHIVISSFR